MSRGRVDGLVVDFGGKLGGPMLVGVALGAGTGTGSVSGLVEGVVGERLRVEGELSKAVVRDWGVGAREGSRLVESESAVVGGGIRRVELSEDMLRTLAAIKGELPLDMVRATKLERAIMLQVEAIGSSDSSTNLQRALEHLSRLWGLFESAKRGLDDGDDRVWLEQAGRIAADVTKMVSGQGRAK